MNTSQDIAPRRAWDDRQPARRSRRAARDIVLGIDTGGTYTDGVLLDYATKQVLATSKTLTTHHDLATGILNAVDALAITEPSKVRLVSISTTLATNAVAEGAGKPKGGPVVLLLLGYDAELIEQFGFASRFGTPRHFFVQGGHDLNGNPQAPLDSAALVEHLAGLRNEAEAIAVSGYFSPLNPAHEEEAARIIAAWTANGDAQLPIVLGHQLSMRLDSVKRATTAALNASLLPLLRDFIVAVGRAIAQRGIEAPLMVVRGDGAMVSSSVAERRPVETVHSGPAASAVGGQFLAGVERALVVDVGGTTTDVALVDGGRVKVTEEGAVVGGFRTSVQAADIRSIGLGGDSHLSFDREDQLAIGPQRVVPLASLAAEYPRVAQELLALRHRPAAESVHGWTEYWFLVREPPARAMNNPMLVRVVDILREEGPQPLKVLLDRLGLLHPLQFGGQVLLEADVVRRGGLTPTDLLHVTGEYAPWDVDVARIVAEKLSRLRGWDLDEFVERVKAGIAERVVGEVVAFLTQRPLPPPLPHPAGRVLGRWLFDNAVNTNISQAAGASPYLETQLRLRVPIVGIGAPAGIFLPRVAELLHTDLILPEHYAVANAVGAVAASVVASQEAHIYPHVVQQRVAGYYVQCAENRQHFDRLEVALDYASATARGLSLAAAREAGAADPQPSVVVAPDGADAYRVTARAVGSPRLG